eukprot:CAMPEP_0176152672 /NCGR_PEP_ID=MMETSP0120_2-20121206/77977_1 /TAXON_ID=160619 /ORGANISM="Kryptoperidinium foliaceum, Strain CCMP 1326" /LENGTH=1159 /DNA_ID=CAMNT_0017489687 /DNA_START=61 /DNA_END=3537 /DNA_ORIENTATION=+
MALVKAMELFGAALYETASVLWTEIAMFGVAALCYVFFIGGLPLFGKAGKPPSGQKKGVHAASRASAGGAVKTTSPAPPPPSEARNAVRAHAARGEWRSAVCVWHRVKRTDEALQLDLAPVVEAMRRSGSRPAEVAEDLRAAAAERPQLVEGIAKLPRALLQDESADLLDAILALLEDLGRPADPSAYTVLMASAVRRRRPEEVVAMAARVPGGALTPPMRALLGAAAAQRGNLAEALEQIRKVPDAPKSGEGLLAPAAVAQVLSLACSQELLGEAAAELRRLKLTVDVKMFDELLSSEARRTDRPATQLRQLLHAGVALGVPLRPAALQTVAAAAARDKDGPGLRSLCDELEESSKGADGVAVSEPLSLAMMAAANAVGDLRVASRVLEMHRAACAGAPGGRVLGAYCSALLSAGRGVEACDFFEAELLPRSLAPDPALAESLAAAAAQAGRKELAERLPSLVSAPRSAALRRAPLKAAPPKAQVADATGDSGASDVDRLTAAVIAAIRACTKDRDFEGAEAAFGAAAPEVAGAAAVKGAFLEACLRCGEGSRAEGLWREMGGSDLAAGTSMIKWHVAAGRADEALAVARDLISAGQQPGGAVFNDMLQIKVAQNDRRGVWRIVEEMQRAGLRPSGAFCATLAKSLTSHSVPEDVRRIVRLIQDIESHPDEVLLAAVVDAFMRIRRLDVLSELLRGFRAKGARMALASPTYGSLIKAYGQAGDVGCVHELWQQMEDNGVRPTSITVGCAVEALVSNNEVEAAYELVRKQLEDPERRGVVNTVAFSTLLKGFANAKQVDRVFAVYAGMRERGVPCHTITYNTILDACAKACAMDRVAGVLQDMVASGSEPDIITYSTIAKGYCAQGDVERAMSTLKEMQTQGKLTPDEIMYNSILDGCAKQHRVDDALKLLEEMKLAGIAPSNCTLSILVKLLGQARQLDRAFQMVEDLSSQNDLRPNVQVYTCLLQGCFLNKELDRAFELHDRIVKQDDCPPLDDKFYGVLARGCLQLHAPLRAVDVVRIAYRLPAGPRSRAEAIGRGPAIGVEPRALEEVAAALRSGVEEHQQAFEVLSADLQRLRGVSLADPSSAGSSPDAAAAALSDGAAVAAEGASERRRTRRSFSLGKIASSSCSSCPPPTLSISCPVRSVAVRDVACAEPLA